MPLRKLALSTLATAALAAGAFAQSTYVVGGPAASLQPSSGALGWDGGSMASYRAALQDPSNFGPNGRHTTSVQTRSLDTVNSATLAGLDAFVCASWNDAEMSPAQLDALLDYFLGGGDLVVIAEDFNHDAIAARLGLTVRTGFNENSAETAVPFGNGDFSVVPNQVVSLTNPGYVDLGRVVSKNGHVGAITQFQLPVAAWWSKGDFGPNTGALVIVCDPGLVTDGNYQSEDGLARWALNLTAFLAARQQVRILGGPAGVLQPSSLPFRWETGAAMGDVKYALARSDYFGSEAPGEVDVRFHFFSDFNASSLHLCDTFIVPFWKDADLSAAHRSALKSAYAGGMNLVVWLDATDEAALLSDLGLGVQTGTRTSALTNAPLRQGPFGTVSALQRPSNLTVLDPADVQNRNGYVGATDIDGNVVAAYWRSADLPGYYANLLVVTDAAYMSNFHADFFNLNSYAQFTLNAFHHVLTDRKIRVAGPGANLNSSVEGWAGNGTTPFRNAISDDAYFGPQGISPLSIEALDIFTMDEVTLATMDVFVTGHWTDIELLPSYVTMIQKFVHRGGKLLMAVDDVASDALTPAFGLIAYNGNADTTTGVWPAYNGVFGPSSVVYQAGKVVVWDETFITGMGGQVIGRNTLLQPSVLWLRESAVAPRSGDIIALGDPEMLTLTAFGPLGDNSAFALNIMDHLARSTPDRPARHYGEGHPGAGGYTPTLRMDGEFYDYTMARLRIDNAVGQGLALILFGTSGRLNFPYRDATVLVNFPWVPMYVSLGGASGVAGVGSRELTGRVPAGLSGLPQGVNIQALIYDAMASSGLAATDGIEILIP